MVIKGSSSLLNSGIDKGTKWCNKASTYLKIHFKDGEDLGKTKDNILKKKQQKYNNCFLYL